MKITLVQEDITELNVDVIVNAANNALLGGGGVDGAIHRKAGPELLAECRTLNGCETGDAKITKGYKLKAKHIIHTVGPVFKDGKSNEDELLASCYLKSLSLAEENNCKTIAFPCVSTGIYGFPSERAAKIVVNSLKDFEAKGVEEVILCCFMQNDFDIYSRLLKPSI
jgi:O-acetyl-ADP-ribose deacetylase (regulator of RNase III)